MIKLSSIRKTEIRHVRHWIKSGWFIIKQDVLFWIYVASIYMAIALVLSFIPWLGPLLLVLISPILFGSTLKTTHSLTLIIKKKMGEGKIKKNGKMKIRFSKRSLVKSPKALFHILEKMDALIPLVFLSVLLLATVAIIQIIVMLAVGTTTNIGMFGHGFAHAVNVFLAGFLLFVSFYVVGMGMFFAVHRILFNKEMFINAIYSSYMACIKNLVPLTILAFIFVIPIFICTIIASYTYIGYLLLVLVSLAAIPLFITSSYLSYRKIFN